VPVALFGLLFFVVITGLLVSERRGGPKAAENVPGYVFALSTVGLAVVLYLAYAAFFVLKAVCLFCVLTYVAVIGLFIVAGAATTYPMTTLPRRALDDLRAAVRSPLALTACGVLLVGAASGVAFFPREAASSAEAAAVAAAAPALTTEQQSEVERWFDSQPRAIVPVDPEGAAVLIVRFSDYQCPACGRTHQDYKPILAKYASQAPGKVRLVAKDFPLEPECNSNVQRGSHVSSCEAAVAVRLAREKSESAAASLEDWLYANQAVLTPAMVRDGARQVAGIRDFDAQYPRALEQVKSDAALAALLGVKATPTFFVNGVKIEGGMEPRYFDAIIGYELKKTSQ
jgi:protein-disulfide isomerase